MKKLFSLFLIATIAFSCSKIKDATTVDFDTTISVDIPVSVEAPVASITKSAAANTFSATKTFSLKDDPVAGDYAGLIKTLGIDRIALKIEGLSEGQVIQNLVLAVEGVGTVATLSNISDAEYITPEVGNAILVSVAEKLKADQKLTVTVSGTTNETPMTFKVTNLMDTHITASVL